MYHHQRGGEKYKGRGDGRFYEVHSYSGEEMRGKERREREREQTDFPHLCCNTMASYTCRLCVC